MFESFMNENKIVAISVLHSGDQHWGICDISGKETLTVEIECLDSNGETFTLDVSTRYLSKIEDFQTVEYLTERLEEMRFQGYENEAKNIEKQIKALTE